MMVLFDMEWVTDRNGREMPTQIAAMRVDSTWNPLDRFETLIRPVGLGSIRSDHVGFGGLPRQAYQNAELLVDAMESIRQWLLRDDILLWWAREADCLFRRFYRSVLHEAVARPSYYLDEPIRHGAGLPERKSLYAAAQMTGIAMQGNEHEAASDVELLAGLLRTLQITPADVVAPEEEENAAHTMDLSQYSYWYDLEQGLVHENDCPALEGKTQLQGYHTLTAVIRKGYVPCPDCCAHDYRMAGREYIQKKIADSPFNFVYTEHSKVFHHYSCKTILAVKSMSSIAGTTYYENALETGRCPCKVCRPNAGSARKTGRNNKYFERELSRPERQAVKRFAQAKRERQEMKTRTDLTEQQINDLYTLTQPRFAFWAAQGYETFHTRNCTKLKGRSGVQGFARYQDARRAGYAPCRFCKPTAKMNAVLSIPINNRVVEQETTAVLESACRKAGFPFEQDRTYFQLETPVGIWRIRLTVKPYQIEHINLIHTPGNRTGFHTQPRLFLSLSDIFSYIVRHDRSLEQQTQRTETRNKVVYLSDSETRRQLAK